MYIDNLGLAVYSSKDIEEILFTGQSNILDEILVDNDDADILRYNESARLMGDKELRLYQPLNFSKEEFDHSLQQNWLMPDEYKTLDIEDFLVNACPKENYQRLIEELEAYRQRNMLDLLRWLKYFVDTCRANNVVWGVGRGSSVASYVLFLIGVHKIDSLKYNLDWHEFLR
jgi:DNA polymerase III alpha subunit